MDYNPIIKILTLQSSVKNQWNKKLLFQAPTFKNNLFNTKYVSSHFFPTMYGPQDKYYIYKDINKYLGTHISNDLTWPEQTQAVVKKAQQCLFFLRRHPDGILSGSITTWFRNSTAANRKALLRVIQTAQHITGGELPSLQAIYNIRCVRKVWKIIKDPSHPRHSLLLLLLPSGRCYKSIRARTSRLWDSFFPQAIRLLNYNWCTTLLHKYIINITIQHTYPHYIYYVYAYHKSNSWCYVYYVYVLYCRC